MESKNKLLNKLYYDEAGFSSIQNLYKEAKQIDKSISLAFVKEWHNNNVGKSRYYGGKNSFVAPGANYEYQVDLFFISDLENQKYNIGFICIDIFTKYCVVVPIKSKQEGDVAQGLIEALHKMGKKPIYIYSDDEGSLNSNSIQTYLKEQGIKHVVTRTHAHYAERMVRTLKAIELIMI